MADDTTAPAPDAPTYDPAIINQMIQQMLQPPQLPQQSQAPVERSTTSLLGEALGGGSQYGSPAEREAAGNRALLSLGVGMLGASGYSPVRRTLGEVVAQGIGGAEQSLARSGSVAAAQLAAQQDYAKTQQEMQISRLKEVLPLLKMQAGMATPNTLLGSKPNTSIGAVGGDTYEGAIGGHEGLGPDPRLPSTVGGFRPDTWQGFVTANPDLFKGMSPDQIAAARSNPQLNAAGIAWLAQQNADALTKAGVTPSGPALGVAHYIGAGAASKALQAPDNTPVRNFVSADAIKYNPELGTMTVGQLKQRYANVPAPAFLGGPKPSAAPAVTAQAPPAAPAGAPGVAQGDAAHPELAPGPPGSKGGAPIGIGAALAPPVVAGTPLPAGKLQSTGKPPGQAAADIIQGGVQLAQATPLVRGTGQEAGPSSAVATLATPAAPQPGWGTGAAAGYNTGTTTALQAAPAPQAPTQAQQPPPVTQPITAPAPPPGGLTFEQFQQQHPLVIPDEERRTWTVQPPNLTDAIAAKAEAARQLSLARAGISGDPNKSLSDFTTASQNVTKLQQDAQTKSLELQQASMQHARDTQRQLYDAEMQRQAQAAEAERQRQAAVALETQRGNQAIDLEKVKAGQTWHQKLEEQAATYAQENTIKPMAAAAQKAHQMNLGLAQMQAILPDLPPGGGPLGAVLEAHPDLAPLFNSAGILTEKNANAVRLINGLVSNISTEMKPAGLGALREYEWDAFKAQLPSMLSTPAGQQKALALLMNMNDRIGSEHSWMSNYFSRKVPDELSPTPGATRSAHNLESDNPNESVQQRMDRELGPIIPRYAGPPSGSGQTQWEASLPPGKPYYKTWAQPDPQHPGQPLRDSNGNIKTTRTLEIRPWQ